MKLLRLLALLIVVFSVVLLISVRSILPEGTLAPRHTRWTVTVFVLTAMVAMLVLFVQIKRGIYTRTCELHSNNKHHVDRATSFLEKYGFVFGLYIFGAGSIYLQVHYLISNVQCLRFYVGNSGGHNSTYVEELFNVMFSDSHKSKNPSNSRVEAISKLAMSVVISCYFILKIPFLVLCRQLGNPLRRPLTNHLYLFIIAADVAVWFYVFIRESNILETYSDMHHNIETNLNQSLANSCLTHSTLMQSEESSTLEHMMFPLSMEFALASLEILIHVWLMEVAHNIEETDEDIASYQPLLGSSGSLSDTEQLAVLMVMNGLPANDWREVREENQHGGERLDGHPGGGASIDNNSTAGSVSGTMEHGAPNPPIVRRDSTISAEFVDAPNHAFLPTREQRGEPLPLEVIVKSLISFFNVHLAFFLGIIMFVILQYYLLHSENGIPLENTSYMNREDFQLTVKLPSVVARVICGGLPGLVTSGYAATIMSTFNSQRPGAQGTKGSDVLLAMAVVGIICLSSFEVRHVETRIYLFYPVIELI